jgi:imidazole glycerol phosphate synthase glutamine amidotransferase subunit
VTTAPEVFVVRTGAANLASVMAGLERLGARPRLTRDPAAVAAADYLVLPGVGAFGAAIEELGSHGLIEALRVRIAADRPSLCVCLGLQLLARSSEESPGVNGLGVLPLDAGRFTGPVRVPQLGWNRIEPEPGCRFLQAGHVYFANSYRLTEKPAGWNVAWSEYGGRFVAAVERGNVLGCQFHPELSSAFGQALLGRWLSMEPQPC